MMKRNLFNRIAAGVVGGILALHFCPAHAAVEVESLFVEPNPGWRVTRDTFPAAWQQAGCLYWSDESFRQLRYYYADTEEELTVAHIPVAEGEFFCAPEGGLKRIELILFSAGEDFNAGLRPEEVIQYLSAYTGVAPDGQRQSVALNDCTLHVVTWRWNTGQAALLWAENERGIAYIKLVITPATVDWVASLQVRNWSYPLRSLPERLEVPAVRQGDRQYCTAAAVERVMRYYGSTLDQHLAAAIIGVDGETGAQMPDVMKALGKVEETLKVKTQMVYVNADYESFEAIYGFFKRYNLYAKRLQQPQFNTDRIRRMPGDRARRTLTNGLGTLNRKVLAEMRKDNQVGLDTFRTKIVHYLRRGVPLLWTALADGGDDQVAFHMLLINGYDVAKDTIYYTDSADSAGKTLSMKSEEAWSISNHLAVIIPTADAKAPERPETAAAPPPAAR